MTDQSNYERDLHYSLSKRVPEMARGFTIVTNYGNICIDSADALPFIAATRTAILFELGEEVTPPTSASQAAPCRCLPDMTIARIAEVAAARGESFDEALLLLINHSLNDRHAHGVDLWESKCDHE